MGQQKSRIAGLVPPGSSGSSNGGADASLTGTVDPSAELGERVSLAPPNAAVIGAGVAGVHVAYELAKIGFKITVFERQNEVANGETQFSLPFVGVGLVEPALVRASLRTEALRGMILPTTCPDLIAREHLLHTVMNPVVYRWMWGRLRSCFTDKEVMCYTNNLSRVSHTVVRDLVNKYPHLQEHVFTGPVMVLDEKKEVAATAHGEPFMVDPVGWTRAMADICRSQFGVEFAMNVRLEDTNTYLKYDVESLQSIRVSKPDPLNPDQRVFASERYDVVVLAAGASTGTITLPNSRLPILGLSGLSAVVQQPAGSMRDALWSLFQRKSAATAHVNVSVGQGSEQNSAPSSPSSSSSSFGDAAAVSLARPAPGTLALLSSKCSLYGYTWPGPGSAHGDAAGVSSMVQSKVMPAAQDYVLQGLLSLDTIVKSRSESIVAKQLSRLESYIRIKSGAVVPLESPAGAAKQKAEGEAAAESPHANQVHVSQYVRAFTPDGVPLVDHSGGAFNCFVCSGFGDHAMDFAPGAAKVLGKLVEHQAQRLREEDLENVKTWGVLTSKLTPSRRAEVESDLQMLLNGIVPPKDLAVQRSSSSSSAKAAAAAVAATSTTPSDPAAAPLLHFEMNPFSTNRFTNLVKKEVKDATSLSWLDQFYNFENRVILRSEPYRIAFHHKLMSLAERDNVPDAVRSFVFAHFFDERDDPESLRQRESYKEAMQKLVDTYEASVAAAATQEQLQKESAAVAPLSQRMPADGDGTATPAERSRRRQAEMERQARELFSKP